MTRDQLENVLWHAGLTRDQVNEIMPAITRYATTQAGKALEPVVQKGTSHEQPR